MKKTLQVAKNELYSLFFSPIAWVMLSMFSLLTSMDYVGATFQAVINTAQGGPILEVLENLTNEILVNPLNGFYRGIIRNLYILLPFVTMALISKEKSGGTIKLLYSSPLKFSEIVFGKFLAMACYLGCFMLLLSADLIALANSLNHTDFGQIIASSVGLYLVLVTYAAIGLFMSSLSSYQVVAAIITFAFFSFLNSVGGIWQNHPLFRDITFYMNLTGKAENMLKGLPNLRDFCYFLILLFSFLAFTIIRLKSGTESIKWYKKGLRYAYVITAASILAIVTSNPWINVYVDATRTQRYTITPPTQEVLAKLDSGALHITCYGNLMNDNYYSFSPEAVNSMITNVWEPYIRFKPDIHFTFVNYWALDTNSYIYRSNPGMTPLEIVKQQAENGDMDADDFISEQEVAKQIDVRPEECRNFYILTYKGRSVVLRTFVDQIFFPLEDEIAAALKRLIMPAPKIGFLTGEIERGPYSRRPRDYMGMTHAIGLRHSLLNQGYDFDTICLKQLPEVPAGLATLVIADPRKPLSPDDIAKIGRYIDQGGNLLIAAEPDRKDVIQPILDKVGVTLMPGMLIQPDKRFSSDLAFPYLTPKAEELSPQFTLACAHRRIYWGDSLLLVAMPGACGLTVNPTSGFIATPLLYSEAVKSWNRLAPVSDDSLNLPLGHRPDDQPGSFITALRLNRTINGKEQRIIVAGDADFPSSEPAVRGNVPNRNNSGFAFCCFSYFSYGVFPANTLRPESTDRNFSITADDLETQKFWLFWVLPGFLGILGSVIIIRRKRK